MKKFLRIIISLLIVAGLGYFAINAWLEYGVEESNPNDYASIGEIPTPDGFKRIDGDEPKFGTYLRSLPLKSIGAVVKYYYGVVADLQELNYAVVDLPLLSNAEQCADVCMRLRAEYLYQSGHASNIKFTDVQGNVLTYSGEDSRELFEDYLRKVFDKANTYSLRKEMTVRNIADIQPGDVFVYAGNSERNGHAVMVADVAYNPDKDQIAVILVQGFMPARSIHVIRNLEDPINSPWFIIDGESDGLSFPPFEFSYTDLRCFSPIN